MVSSKISDLLEKINKSAKKPDFPVLAKIELDLVMQHVRELYDELDNIKSNATQPGRQEPAVVIPPVTEVAPVKKTIYANKDLLLNDTQPKQEPVKQEAKPEIKQVKVAEPVVEVAPVTAPKVNKAVSINEKVSTANTLNETIKTGTGKEVHKNLAAKPLREQLDLNKRFVLLNELFKGNSEAFTSAIDHIDSLHTFEEADAFIKSQLMSNYFWDEASQTTRMFVKMVKLKFGVE